MANIVGEGFPEVIIGQINARQKVYGSINRTPQQLTYLNARTGWCKLVSSVNIDGTPPRGIKIGGDKLARQFILFNGTSNQVDKADLRQRYGVWPGTSTPGSDFYAYGMGGTNFGLNAMPGVISAEIKTETRGSLKTATIKIKANNRNQFDIIDVLYMRLGFTLLLEWGNSSYFKNDGTFVADYTSLADNFLDGTLNYSNAFDTIEKKRLAAYGNYDAIVGKVVNFQWSFLKDGTYDITVTLRSMGDVIESLKTNTLLPGAAVDTSTSGSAEGETETSEEGEEPEPTAEDVIKDFANTHEIGKFFYKTQQKMAPLGTTTSGMSYLSAGDGTVSFIKQKYEDEGGTQYYVRLGRFLKFIENRLIPYVDNPEVKLLGIDTDPNTNLIYMLGRQISTDPGVCIFNTSVTLDDGSFVNFAEKGEIFYSEEINGNRYGKIMNAYFNMVYILTQMDSLKNEDGKVPLYDLLNCLCTGWNNATGNFSKLEPTIDSEKNLIIFTDEVVCPDRDEILKKQEKSTELAVFDVYGYYYRNNVPHAGFIKDISFTTTVSPNLASMITIGATAGGYVPGEDATAISAMNKGLVDRFKEKIKLQATQNNNTKGSSSLEESYKEELTAFNTFVSELGSLNGNTVPKWNPEAISAFSNAASSLFEYDQAKQTEEKKDTDKNAASPNGGFLPFDLSLTMDGLSGMKVYQKYIIDTTYLPSNYPTSLEFLIKGITNTIQGNDWSTTIESIAIPKNPFGSKVGKGAVSQASSNSSTPAGNDRDVVRGTAPKVKGSKTWNGLSKDQKNSAIYLYNTLLSYGFTDIEARAVLGIVSKESAFVPRNETSYSGTKAARIRQVFPSKFKNKTDAEIDVIKKNPQQFFDTIYGGRYGNAANEGYKYRGRGFNQLTFKGNYKVYNDLYKSNGSKAGAIDIITNPDLVNQAEGGIYKVASHIASLYFKRNKSNFFPKAPTNDLDTAIFNFMRANAGWGTSTNGAIFQEGLAKARAFVYSLPEKLS
jgi:putative chitinase